MITAYTKTGSRHQEANIPCQDAVYHIQTENLTVLALADGVSACPLSHIGAEVACRAAAEYVAEFAGSLSQCSEQKLAYLILDQVRFCLEEKAREIGCKPQDLSSTLTLCCIPNATRNALLFQLGDGGVFALEGGEVTSLFPLHRTPGGPVSTMTSGAHRAARIRRIPLPGMAQVLLCSDGLLKAFASQREEKPISGALERGDLNRMTQLLDTGSFADDVSFICA